MATITRENTDVVLQRVALLAFLYYPEVHINEPDYSLTEDIAFCLEPLTGLDDDQRDALRNLLGQAIINPTEYREDVFAEVTALAVEGSVEQ